MEDWIFKPIVQYGFAGLVPVLLVIIVWLIRRLLGVLEQNNKVIIGNTEAVGDLSVMTRDLLLLNRSLHDKIISRPCIAKGEKV